MNEENEVIEYEDELENKTTVTTDKDGTFFPLQDESTYLSYFVGGIIFRPGMDFLLHQAAISQLIARLSPDEITTDEGPDPVLPIACEEDMD